MVVYLVSGEYAVIKDSSLALESLLACKHADVDLVIRNYAPAVVGWLKYPPSSPVESSPR